MTTDILQVNRGALAEQFVAQELAAYHDPYAPVKQHYWARAARTSSAEVDYLTTDGSRVIPLEVKAGATGRLRCLRLSMEQFGSPVGMRISQQPLSWEQPIVSVPLYALQALPHILETVLEKRPGTQEK